MKERTQTKENGTRIDKACKENKTLIRKINRLKVVVTISNRFVSSIVLGYLLSEESYPKTPRARNIFFYYSSKKIDPTKFQKNTDTAMAQRLKSNGAKTSLSLPHCKIYT